MTEDIVELARAIHKCKPNATMHVTVWLRDYSAENVETLSSKGLKVRTVIERLKMVTGEVKAEPTIAQAIQNLDIVKKMSPSSELEVL